MQTQRGEDRDEKKINTGRKKASKLLTDWLILED